MILKATLDYPARFGQSLVEDIKKYGRLWSGRVQARLRPYFSDLDDDAIGACYLWARTVACPSTGKPVPLSPNWWIRKGSDPTAVRVIADPSEVRCRFEIVRGATACKKADPDKGTVKRGTGISPWTGDTIDGNYIKAEAQASRMGQQLYAVGIKKTRDFTFRPPTQADVEAVVRAEQEAKKQFPRWQSKGLIPEEPRQEGRADWSCKIYGQKTWAHALSRRQLLANCVALEELIELTKQADVASEKAKNDAVVVLLALAFDKAVNYNSTHCFWDYTRSKIAHAFSRHDFAFRFSFSEFDSSHNLFPWCIEQVEDAYRQIAKLATVPLKLFEAGVPNDSRTVTITKGAAQSLSVVPTQSLRSITVDPPYYDNVMYAECSNYFYVWLKRILGNRFPEIFDTELANEDDEAVMNAARFRSMGKRAKTLATADYENKMFACFKEMNRVLHPDGVLTVMFTHKQVQAWDTLGSSLMRAGFRIDASWPVHTESEASLHQAKKNAAASTILLVCRKREAASESAWWDDLKGQVKETARETAQRFEKDDIRGVDLYISTFGPVLSIISERWPVLTSNTDPKTGDPIPLQPGEALDLARREVINLRKQGLLLGRSVEFDPVTDWYLMAWDAFRAQEFPADEARKLALALGLDFEAHLVGDKRLVTKKGKNVSIALPTVRRKKGMVDPEAESFTHLIDALHTAMMVYEEDGSKACQVFIDRHGLRNDSRIKALVQAAMQAIPTTRGKDGKFLRPEMTTLDALRLLVWEDLPAPPEEEPPKIGTQMVLFGKPSSDQEGDETDEDLDEHAEDDDEESDDE